MYKYPFRAKSKSEIFLTSPWGLCPQTPGIYRFEDICVGGEGATQERKKGRLSKETALTHSHPCRRSGCFPARALSSARAMEIIQFYKKGIKYGAAQLVKVYADLTRNGVRLLTL